jgi:hypothetical protein
MNFNDVTGEFLFQPITDETLRYCEFTIKNGFPGNYTVTAVEIDRGIRLIFNFESDEDETVFRLKYDISSYFEPI